MRVVEEEVMLKGEERNVPGGMYKTPPLLAERRDRQVDKGMSFRVTPSPTPPQSRWRFNSKDTTTHTKNEKSSTNNIYRKK
jgi:hypothetical protein